MSWTDVSDAIQRAIARAAQITARQVIWKYQDVDAPAIDYVALSLNTAATLGLDWLTTSTDLNRPAGQEIAMRIDGVREVALEIECFSASVADDADAMARAELIRTSLLLPTVRDILTAAGISPFDPGPVQYVPAVVAAGFRGRATCTVRCYIGAQSVTEYVTYIAHVRGSLKVLPSAKVISFAADDLQWKWIERPFPVTGERFLFWSVYGFADDNVYSIGNNRLLYHWTGSSWIDTNLWNCYNVWGPSADNVYVVGNLSTDAHGPPGILQSTDQGATWAKISTVDPQLGDFVGGFAGSGNTLFVSGWRVSGTTVSVVWKSTDGGSTWSILFTTDLPAGDRPFINAIHCISPTDVWFVGERETIYHYDGVTVTQVQRGSFAFHNQSNPPRNDNNIYTTVWGAAPGSAYFGSLAPVLPTTQIEHYLNGVIFEENVPFPTNGDVAPSIEIQGIFGANASTVWAVGTGTQTDAKPHVYKLQSIDPQTGVGTWVEDLTLPANAQPQGVDNSGLFALWVNPATGVVVALGQRSTDNMITTYWRVKV